MTASSPAGIDISSVPAFSRSFSPDQLRDWLALSGTPLSQIRGLDIEADHVTLSVTPQGLHRAPFAYVDVTWGSVGSALFLLDPRCDPKERVRGVIVDMATVFRNQEIFRSSLFTLAAGVSSGRRCEGTVFPVADPRLVRSLLVTPRCILSLSPEDGDGIVFVRGTDNVLIAGMRDGKGKVTKVGFLPMNSVFTMLAGPSPLDLYRTKDWKWTETPEGLNVADISIPNTIGSDDSLYSEGSVHALVTFEGGRVAHLHFEQLHDGGYARGAFGTTPTELGMTPIGRVGQNAFASYRSGVRGSSVMLQTLERLTGADSPNAIRNYLLGRPEV